MTDPVTDTDILSYVDDQLDTSRRIDVEAYLAARPEEAARVMADLRLHDELRLALSVPSRAVRSGTTEAARQLQRGLLRGRIFAVLQRAAAVAMFVGAGWIAHEAIGPFGVSQSIASVPPPAYVEEAVRAHGTSLLRASMTSQPKVSDYDPAEILSATAITMPALPRDWSVQDVQIYPSRFGPSVELAVHSDSIGDASLFAVRPGTFDVVKPKQTDIGGTASSYFQIGEVAYALVGRGNPRELGASAKKLADSLY
ncbi:MAG TPA: anti-sigma factor [Mesorhizobium sp.]|uniref:anti-sigma factor family protein n=1 Tax=Mesorhizobium sp. TaxID=1871066 RepID=UPI002DDDA16F|nr:anti-sigma factor [Mesorhizobium sp.]HEV2501962.1 anti-sigma factor [Mesorhizobium sp.]